jgi:glycosyltransferase involved in cell wall biosynthesis
VLAHQPWEATREFSFFADLDIGLMPLVDSPLNRGKEGFKIKEYMAAGLPVVCSPVGHNPKLVEHGINGFLASDEDEWIGYLTRLIDDLALRARMGASGRRLVGIRWALSAQAEELADFVLRAAGVDAPSTESSPEAA